MTGSRQRTASSRNSCCEEGSQPLVHGDRTGVAEGRMEGCPSAGSHLRLQKRVRNEVSKLTVPAHRPVKRSTLAHILKQARLDIEQFLELL